MATEASLPAPAGDLGVLLRGRLLLLPASVCQPAEVGGQTQTALTPKQKQRWLPRLHFLPLHTIKKLTERRHLALMTSFVVQVCPVVIGGVEPRFPTHTPANH